MPGTVPRTLIEKAEVVAHQDRFGFRPHIGRNDRRPAWSWRVAAALLTVLRRLC